ncbi:MAG TPA: glycosyltransferase family 2 protein [Urbifossiella sp.]|nr:glycosyltransferase family 2 protein [Urbifossiella sp.]
MKVVAVSMVKNEADVIEAFVRHTAAFVDRHLIFDHQSSDGTGFILKKLQREGLPLEFFHDDRPEFLQTHRTHLLLGRALDAHQADWIVPLDADEILQIDGGPAEFRAVLRGLLPGGQPFRMWMRDFLATAEDDLSEMNPLKRIVHRAPRPHAAKAALPRAFALQPGAGWTHGNHVARIGGIVVGSPIRSDIWLAHLACRSAAQAVTKVVQYTLRRLAEGKWHTVGDNYSRQFRQLASFPRPFLEDPLQYGHGEQCEIAPAEYYGGPLRYASFLTPEEAAMVAVLGSARQVAADHGRLLEAVADIAAPEGRLARFRGRLRRLFGSTSGLPEPVDRLTPPLKEGLVLPDSRGGDGYGCTLEILRAERSKIGIDLAVKVKNIGLCAWLASTEDGVGMVRLGVQTLNAHGRIVDASHQRIDLPGDLDPGDEAILEATVPLPDDSRLALGFDMVAEGIRWFGYRGCRWTIRTQGRLAA